MRTPYQLEPLEGGAAEEVRRVLAGQSIYPAPSIDFVSYTYPPLYFWLSALVGLVTGPGFVALRLVSAGASFATMGVLWKRAGIVAAGVFAAGYSATGRWYDVGRVDSLYVFLLVAFFLAAERATTLRAGAGAGVLLCLAALTKQTAILAAIPLLGYLIIKRPKVGAVTLAAFALPWLIFTLVMNAVTGGWYRYATVDIFVGHAIARTQIVGFWRHDVLRIAVALVVAAVVARRQPVLAFAAVGAIGSSYVSRLHTGGDVNSLIPMYAVLALLLALGADKWRRAAPLLVVAQLALLAYRPVLPHGDTHQRLIAQIRATPGQVLVLAEPYAPVAAGKNGSAQAAAVADVLRAKDERAKQLMLDSFEVDVRSQRWSAVVLLLQRDRHDLPGDFASFYRYDPGRGPGVWYVPRVTSPIP